MDIDAVLLIIAVVFDLVSAPYHSRISLSLSQGVQSTIAPTPPEAESQGDGSQEL